MKVIISGGGTGGHIFPAIAIANTLKEKISNIDLLFVGAEGRMEMEKVPQAGYPIIGLPIAGLQRSFSLEAIKKNILFPFKLLKSLAKAKQIIRDFEPNVVVGVGGYASGPILWAAQKAKIPTLIQEQNGFAGITNKILAKKANTICVAYPGMEKYFPSNKIIIAGNPVRKDILDVSLVKLAGCVHFKLDPNKKTLLIIGGSLGAKTINAAIEKDFEKLKNVGFQLIWQTGKNFVLSENIQLGKGLVVQPFIKEMHWAYACADVVISRAGALSISELSVAAKATILVPSPNVSEDHQTKNALVLVANQAAILVKDAEASQIVVDTALQLLQDLPKCKKLQTNIATFAKPNAANTIADEVLKLVI